MPFRRSLFAKAKHGSINVATQTLNGLNGGFSGYNNRLIIPTTAMSQAYTGKGTVVFTLQFYSTQSGTLDEMWVGHQPAGAAQPYYMDGNQVKLTWNNGSTSLFASGAVTVNSDSVGFTYSPTKPLVVAAHWSGSTDTGLAITNFGTGTNQYLAGASQASASQPTGTWTAGTEWTFVSNIQLSF